MRALFSLQYSNVVSIIVYNIVEYNSFDKNNKYIIRNLHSIYSISLIYLFILSLIKTKLFINVE